MNHSPSFLFHDYETWGVNPRQDYPCQFAAIRTDENLEVIGDPIDIMCQIPNDYLPHPSACLVTGITPQRSLQKGLLETEFAQKILDVMSVPNTCSVGYNSMRFDDEVTRFLFFRNFIDPYAREWKNGNSRWDIIDLARAFYALRPDGINWPLNENGHPSFKLEVLTRENNIEHVGAHDALADVRATIAFAKLMKDTQPKLFDYGLSLRKKQTVQALINLETLTPLLHISAKIPASQGCCTWVLPLAYHPTQPNAVICLDLSRNIDVILNHSVEQIHEKLYAKAEELESPDDRPGIKLIHINKSPFITSAKAIDQQRSTEIGLDRNLCLANYKKVTQNLDCISKVIDVHRIPSEFPPPPVEQRLYSDGFMSNDDKHRCEVIRQAEPGELGTLISQLQPSTLKSLLFLYRGRNFPSSLSYEEMTSWQRHRELSFTEGLTGLSLTEFALELDRLAELHQNQPNSLSVLHTLHQYVQKL
ncbi:exodeoxyribonuclease I [Alteromonas sp. 5E99-2]|uniref:exodeoxyribonuclease I n=1 Tax=Alteromonas sp. 5E99-2 TaxID=2817683 RepID=UPI001A998AE1|nr:exodeoxyribonuclease I [Alteromonas sp. 5E99-2]MBO1254936.1 exodeoxyribonuclease I [Alteromonas sp. 5E99-2]